MLIITNKILWAIATSLIILSSIWFTFKLRFTQLNVKAMFKNLFEKNKNKEGVSSIQSLMLTLASRIGVGSIAGVALGIYIGGIGSVAWLWIISILTAILSFAETVLGIMYRKKESANVFVGGPSYYIEKGLSNKKLALVYAFLIIVCYIGGFLSIQSNTITVSLNEITSVSKYAVGAVLVFITGFSIFGGIKRIVNITGKLVPIMGVLYIVIAVFIILRNINAIPSIIIEIIKQAFNFRSFLGGFLTTFIVGMQRGIFSTEAGLGTGSIAASISNNNNPSGQGYVQIVGVYITSLLICTATAFVLLTSQYTHLSFEDINGIELIQYAFNFHFGTIGSYLLFFFIFLFAFSTILTGYYYGESSLRFLCPNGKPRLFTVLKLFTLLILFLGCILSSSFIWNIVDILVAVLAIINVYALLKLKDEIYKEYYWYKSKNMLK